MEQDRKISREELHQLVWSEATWLMIELIVVELGSQSLSRRSKWRPSFQGREMQLVATAGLEGGVALFADYIPAGLN
jgi:hypothetical protein